MATNKQAFTYLTSRQISFLDLIEDERGIKSRSMAIASIIEDHKKLYAPQLRAFLEVEAEKRGLATHDLMGVAVDILRDMMRGIITESTTYD